MRIWIISGLVGLAVRRPYFHLPGYMERFWLLGGSNPERDERPDTQRGWHRNRIDAWVGRRVAARLHHTLRSDAQRHLHNHPFRYLTIILRGGYFEITAAPDGSECRRWYGPGSIIWRGLDHFHRLELPAGHYCLTLFVMGRKRQPWGFSTPDGFVHWQDYEAGGAA